MGLKEPPDLNQQDFFLLQGKNKTLPICLKTAQLSSQLDQKSEAIHLDESLHGHKKQLPHIQEVVLALVSLVLITAVPPQTLSN